MLMTRNLIFSFLCFCLLKQSAAQADSSQAFKPDQYISAVKEKAEKLNKQLDKTAEKTLAQYRKQEEKIYRKLSKIDSVKAKAYALAAKEKWESLEARLKNPGKLGQYIPGLDSLSTTLNFLNSDSGPLKQAAEIKEKISAAISKTDALKAQLKKAEDIRAFLKERKTQIKEQLEKLGFVKELKKLNKQVYYYAQQINAYKEILNDPQKD